MFLNGTSGAGRSYFGSYLGGNAVYTSYQIGLSSSFRAPDLRRPLTLWMNNISLFVWIITKLICLSVWMYLLLATPNLAKGSDLEPVLVLQILTRSSYVTDTLSFSCSHLYHNDSNNYNRIVMQFHDKFKSTIFISTDSNHVSLSDIASKLYAWSSRPYLKV